MHHGRRQTQNHSHLQGLTRLSFDPRPPVKLRTFIAGWFSSLSWRRRPRPTPHKRLRHGPRPLISDIHLDPLADPAIIKQLIASPVEQRESIFQGSHEVVFALRLGHELSTLCLHSGCSRRASALRLRDIHRGRPSAELLAGIGRSRRNIRPVSGVRRQNRGVRVQQMQNRFKVPVRRLSEITTRVAETTRSRPTVRSRHDLGPVNRARRLARSEEHISISGDSLVPRSHRC